MAIVVDGRLRRQWRDVTRQEAPTTTAAKQQVMLTRLLANVRWRLMPVPTRLQTWESDGRVDFEVYGYDTWNAEGAGFYGLGGNESSSVLSSFGRNANPNDITNLDYLRSTSWDAIAALLAPWGSLPTRVSTATGTDLDRSQQVSSALNTPTLAVLDSSLSSLLAAMTVDPENTAAASTTLAWLDDNPDDWSWVDDGNRTDAMPIAINLLHRCYPHSSPNSYGVLVGSFIREPFGAPAWVKWRKRIIAGFDRGKRFSQVNLTSRHVVNFGSLTLAAGHDRGNDSNIVNLFYEVTTLDGERITSTAQLKAECGINATLGTTYGISGLWNAGPPTWGGGGSDGFVTVGPGATAWQGRYPEDYSVAPPAGVSRAKGFRMRVLAHDIDNGSEGTLPPVATTTYAGVDAMLADGFITVADVEFWPEDLVGPPVSVPVNAEQLTVDVSLNSAIRLAPIVVSGGDGGGF